MDKVKENYQVYIPFEGMESHDSFKMMEEFVALIEDKKTQQRFEDAIGYRKPFQNFKHLLYDYPDLHQQWFEYKDQCYIEFVERQKDLFNYTQQNESDGSVD